MKIWKNKDRNIEQDNDRGRTKSNRGEEERERAKSRPREEERGRARSKALVREPNPDHEKKNVEEQNIIQKNVKLKKGIAALDLGLVKMIIRNEPNLELVIRNMSYWIKRGSHVFAAKR